MRKKSEPDDTSGELAPALRVVDDIVDLRLAERRRARQRATATGERIVDALDSLREDLKCTPVAPVLAPDFSDGWARMLHGSEADKRRHFEMRAQFISILLADPRINDLFARWIRSADLSRQDGVERMLNQPESMSAFMSDLRILVRDEMKLRWAWIVFDLALHFLSVVCLEVLGALPAGLSLAGADEFVGEQRSPFTCLFLAPDPHRPAAEQRQVLVDRFKAFLAEFDRRTKGKLDRRQKEAALRDVSWFYRARVQDPPVSQLQLAREYAASDNGRPDTKVVRAGLATVERVFDVCPYYFKEHVKVGNLTTH